MSKKDEKVFRLPSRASIAGRSSSITNAFIAAIMPIHVPTDAEIDQALKILGMSRQRVGCCYCGGTMTEWDHLKPFVAGREPTGFFTSIYNLVPACGKCNQSKGNKDWEPWMRSKHAALPNLEERIRRLKAYEKWGGILPLTIKRLVGDTEWQRYMKLCENIIRLMREAELEARELKGRLQKAIDGRIA